VARGQEQAEDWDPLIHPGGYGAGG
jgi:hypothetical protein